LVKKIETNALLLLRNKKRDFNALSLAAAARGSRGRQGDKKYPPLGDLYYPTLIWRVFFIALSLYLLFNE
jgi:hypothetical protein